MDAEGLPEIKGFLECSLSDWDGHVVSVVWLGGCNFRCGYCFNYELVLHPEKIKNVPWEPIEKKLGERKGWIDGVCITGGEPTCSSGLPLLVRSIRALGLKVKLDTNGSNPDALKALLPELDYVAMDIKAPLEKYERVARVKVDTEAIKKSISLLIESGVDHEFRTTVLPEHSLEDLKKMALLVKGGRRYVLQQLDPIRPILSKYKRVEPVPKEKMDAMARELNAIIRMKVRAQ